MRQVCLFHLNFGGRDFPLHVCSRLAIGLMNPRRTVTFVLRSTLFVCSLTLILCVTRARGQSPHSAIGLEYRFGVLNEADRTPNNVNPNLGDGSGLSRESNFRLEYTRSLASFFDNSLDLIATLGLSQSIGSFSTGAFTLAYNATSIHLVASAESRFSGIRASIGGWLDIPLTQTLTETILPAGTTRTSGLLHVGVPGGLRLEAGLATPPISGLPITPSLFGEFDVTAYRQPEISFINAISGGVQFRWELGGSKEVVPEVVDAIPASTTPTPIHSEIHFTEHGNRIKSGQAVSIESSDTLIKQYVMLPSQLDPSEIGDGIAPNYIRLTSEQASRFTKDSLTRLDETGICRNLLNILGSRLREASDSRVTLSFTPGRVLRSIGHMTSIQSDGYVRYLIDVFHIPNDRIEQIVPAVDERTIVINGSSSLLDPVVTQWIERSYSLGDIGLDHSITASGATNWKITLTQNGDTITHFGNAAAGQEPSMMLRGISARNASEIVAHIEVEDGTGQRTQSSDTLRFSVHESDPYGRPIPTILRFVLLADSSQSNTTERLIAKAADAAQYGNVRVNVYLHFGDLEALHFLRQRVADALPRAEIPTEAQAPQAGDGLGSRIVVTVLKNP